jgi:superfamily II DNA or RNA helicase
VIVPNCERAAIEKLESDSIHQKTWLHFYVDIFNEGIDILKSTDYYASTNRISTFSSVLGRGLRKIDGKSYVTVIDYRNETTI